MAQSKYEYIAPANPAAAGKVVSGIYEKAQLLTDFLEIGYKYREEPEGEVRILLYGHYRISYIIGDEFIDILAFFTGHWILNGIYPD